MKKISAFFLLMTAVATSQVYAAPAGGEAAGEAAGSAATTLADGNSNAVGIGAIGAILGVALATMGGGGNSEGSTTTTSTSTTTNTTH